MNSRRKAGALAGMGAAIVGATGAILPKAGHVAGASFELWRGLAIGIALPLIVAALVVIARGRSACARG